MTAEECQETHAQNRVRLVVIRQFLDCSGLWRYRASSDDTWFHVSSIDGCHKRMLPRVRLLCLPPKGAFFLAALVTFSIRSMTR